MGRRKSVSEELAVAAIRQRLDPLQTKPRKELATLPEWSSDEIALDGIPALITTYREEAKDARLRVIVQLSTKGEPFLKVFRSRQVFVEGFEFQGEGEVRPLEQSEMYDYN